MRFLAGVVVLAATVAVGGCVSPPPAPQTLVVAYSDVDGADGFSAGDVLISKLVDANGDGVASVGDEVHAGGYPLDIVPTAFGEFGVRRHTVTGVRTPRPGQVEVDIDVGGVAASLEWDHTQSDGHLVEGYFEWHWSGFGSITLSLVDCIERPLGADCSDHLSVFDEAPSQPDTVASDGSVSRPGDNTFIDVDVFVG